MNSIFTRRSVRAFIEKEVEQEKIEKILRAGMQAPSAKNGQPWEFIVVKGKENLEKLSHYNEFASCLKWANVGIVVLGNIERTTLPEFIQQDLAAVTQNMMLEATELGLGTVWFGTTPVQHKMDYITEFFGLEENLQPFSVIAVGYPRDENANRFIDRYDPSRVRYFE